MNTPRHQRGVMALMMAILLIGLISILSLVTVAQYYWAKRDAQKVADMAALSGVQHIQPDCGGQAAQATSTIAAANWGNTAQRGADVTCGNWNPATNASVAPETYFIAGASSSAPGNAIQVVAHTTPVTIIPESIAGNSFQVKAVAIAAKQPPVAAFSVGSQLLELHEDGIVPNLLKVLGLDLGGTTLVGYKGLSNLRITPAGLLRQLNIPVSANADVGTLNSVLADHNISIGSLITAVANIADQQKLANATVTALRALAVQAEAQSLGPIQLGTKQPQGTPRGLFAYINTATTQSALDAQVDALDLVNTALQVANSQHLVDLTKNNDLPGVTLLGGVKLWATVIEPPSIAIGGPGATAYTAQIRVGLRITTDAIPALGPILGALGTVIDIPLVIDVVTGKGVLQGHGPQNQNLCNYDNLGPYATIKTTSTLLNACISDFDPGTLGSTSQPCQDNLEPVTLVKLLGINLIRGDTHIWGLDNTDSLALHVGQTKSVNVNLNLGETVNNIITGVLQLLAGQSVGNSSDTQHSNDSVDTGKMASHLWTEQTIDNGTVACSGLGDSNSDGTKRLACQKAIFQTIQDNAALNSINTGLLPGVVNLLGGIVGGLGDILGGVTTGILGGGCGAAILGHGSVAECQSQISQELLKSTTTDGTTTSNALLSLLGPVLNVLQPVLDQVGEHILEPLVKLLIGKDIGRTDVHLMSLQCHGAQLVY